MSRCAKYPNGTLIQCLMKWQEFTIVDCTKEFPIGPAEIPKMEGLLGKESYFLGLFGTTGLTGENLILRVVHTQAIFEINAGKRRIRLFPTLI